MYISSFTTSNRAKTVGNACKLPTEGQKESRRTAHDWTKLRAAALELSEVDLSVLQDFVPYRFLTPWLRSALVGVSDHARNQLIQLLAARRADSPRPTPYSFDSVIGRPKQIVVDSNG